MQCQFNTEKECPLGRYRSLTFDCQECSKDEKVYNILKVAAKIGEEFYQISR
jgi:hypothetical protein